MSEWLHFALNQWPWAAPAVAIAGAIWRWWSGQRTLAARPREPVRYEAAEEILFPRDGSSPRPGRGLARLLSSPARLALKEAGQAAIEEEMAGLREDLRRVLEDNKRVRAELDLCLGSSGGSTSTGGAASRPSKTPRPRSPMSGG